MNLQDVAVRLKAGDEVLFSKDSECLKELTQLMNRQKHRTLLLWVFEYGRELLEIFEDGYPDEQRPRRAFDLCEAWAQGRVQLEELERAILDCHHVCEELDDEYYVMLCRGLELGLSTIYDREHAIEFATYGLTAVVRRSEKHYQEAVERKLKRYMDTLKLFEEKVDDIGYEWADFLMKEEA